MSFPDKPPILLLRMIVPLTLGLSHSPGTYHTGYKNLRSKELEKSTQGPTAIESQRQDFTCYLFIFASFCKKITPSLKKRKKNSQLLQIGTELENLLVSTRRQAWVRQAWVRQVPAPFRFSFSLRSLNNSCCHTHTGLRRVVPLPWSRLK